jgi:hypothetical protein
MPFEPFYELFPDIAARETRTITVLRENGLPLGTYGFLELFCNEEGCDCRRVFIYVTLGDDLSRSSVHEPLAVISWGWENESFYRDWASFPLSKDDLHELKGPALVRLVQQSQYAPELLQHFEMLIRNDKYAARIVRHYQIYRDAIDRREKAKQALTLVRSKSKPGRNQPCPCGSGKKYKKCCVGKPDAVASDLNKAAPR